MTYITKRKLKQNIQVWSILIFPVLFGFGFFYLVPKIDAILLAFRGYDEFGRLHFVGFENFETFFNFMSKSASDPTIRIAMTNSLKNYLVGLIGPPICVFIAYYIFKKLPFGKIYQFIVMIPQIISSFVLCLVFFKYVENALPETMEQLGFADFPNLLNDARYTYGTTLFYSIWSGFATTILLYCSSMSSIDLSVLESARLDGVGFFQELFYIVIPLIGGTISTGFITGIGGIFTASGPLLAFWEYSAPPETINMGYYFTQQVMLYKDNQITYPMLAAMGLVFTLISTPLVLLVKKLFDKIVPEV